MQVVIHGRLANGSFDASFDGVRMTVPDEAKNMHRQLIQIEVVDKGRTLPEYQPPPPTSAEVDTERDRRIALGFEFNGSTYQSRPEDLANINGAVTMAAAATLAGAKAGDFRWANPKEDFAWLTFGNEPVNMDAPTMIAFGQAAMQHKASLIWKGRAIKDSEGGIPRDYTANEYWV